MATTATSVRKKILVAESDAPTAQIIQELLTRHGFEVILVREGRQALRKVLTENPDAILLDTALVAANRLDVCGDAALPEGHEGRPAGFSHR